jgi:hypothetical protein
MHAAAQPPAMLQTVHDMLPMAVLLHLAGAGQLIRVSVTKIAPCNLWLWRTRLQATAADRLLLSLRCKALPLKPCGSLCKVSGTPALCSSTSQEAPISAHIMHRFSCMHVLNTSAGVLVLHAGGL